MSVPASHDAILFQVLHGLVIRGMVQPGPLAASTGLAAGELGAALGRLRDAGLARHTEARGLWQATPRGKAEHARLLGDDLPPPAMDRLRPGYQRFVVLNGQLKAICARWQLRGGMPNDHRDTAYDQRCVSELAGLHLQAGDVIGDLAAIRARFGRYSQRLSAALARLRGGDQSAFTGVLGDSYHDVWMELHRDLLLSLRIGREAEDAAHAAGWPVGIPR